MKILKFIIPIVALSFFISCSEDDNNDDNTPINEIENQIKVQNIENDSHTIEVYTQSGFLMQGYNEITIRIKDKTTNEFVEKEFSYTLFNFSEEQKKQNYYQENYSYLNTYTLFHPPQGIV